MTEKFYKNSTEIMQLHGIPITLPDVVDACLLGRLNLFLQGDTGTGKTQLAKDAMSYFPEKSLFILGRNDMDTRELFQQVNPEFFQELRKGQIKEGMSYKELTDKINTNLIVVDELPNCVPAVRAQLFNLFDGYVEINGKAYPIGEGYSMGVATGNIGQRFTESSNDLGRALKDRMHVIIDTDYFFPKPSDTLDILAQSTNPRVEFSYTLKPGENNIMKRHNELASQDIPLEKLIVANYLLHGLDYCSKGSKREMGDAWPTQLENHEQGSDVGLVLSVSPRAAKSIVRLSQSFDAIARQKAGEDPELETPNIEDGCLDSMMQAFRLVGAYSGILNDAAVENIYGGNRYKALDAVIATTKTQFDRQGRNIKAGLEMVEDGKWVDKVLNAYTDRWTFMRDTLAGWKRHYDNQKTN
jgi:MoxR-like ATPase